MNSVYSPAIKSINWRKYQQKEKKEIKKSINNRACSESPTNYTWIGDVLESAIAGDCETITDSLQKGAPMHQMRTEAISPNCPDILFKNAANDDNAPFDVKIEFNFATYDCTHCESNVGCSIRVNKVNHTIEPPEFTVQIVNICSVIARVAIYSQLWHSVRLQWQEQTKCNCTYVSVSLRQQYHLHPFNNNQRKSVLDVNMIG